MPSPLSGFAVLSSGEDGSDFFRLPFQAPLPFIDKHNDTAIRTPSDAMLSSCPGRCCFGRGRGRTIITDRFQFWLGHACLAQACELPLPEKQETVALVVAC